MIALLDTTAFSAAMRYEEDMVRFLADRRPGDVVTAPPVVAEIEYGVARLAAGSRKQGLLEAEKERLLEVIRVVDWSPQASRHFGRMKAYLEHAGTPVDDFDIAIAAIAAAHEMVVITANLVHFERIPELHASHWRA